jgi:hypothetical protein
MLKELLPFVFATQEEEAPRAPAPENTGRSAEPAMRTGSGPGGFACFEEIYQDSAVRSAAASYSILKVAEMASSGRLEGMSTESKRSALLMALDAAGVSVDDLLQDAMVRQRAVNDYEELQQKKLKELETAKLEENSRIQAELDKISAQHIARIQRNLDDLAHQQDLFQAWQKSKQAESRRISDTAALCVPQGIATGASGSLGLVIERVTGARR